VPHQNDSDPALARDAAPEAPDLGTAPPRRGVMAMGAAAALGAAGAAALAGCASGAAAGSTTAAPGTAAPSTSTAAPSSPSSTAHVLSKLADVPVGSSRLAAGTDGKPIIIAQPTPGKVVAFSALCTHMGCRVLVDKAQLDCPCHGSIFDAFTGKVKQGPARRSLPSVPVKVVGTDVVPG
jgi:cytochrome b6-f complex iron-sulfur subunit